MEIEAKFKVPNATVLAHLNQLESIAGFNVLPAKEKHLRDCYLDTPKRRLLAQRYAFRRRTQQDGDWMMSLKGLGNADGAVHRREELETKLMPQLSQRAPDDWHNSDVYRRLKTLLGNAQLEILFCLSQDRIVRRLGDDDRIVAEMSLDTVHLDTQDNGDSLAFYELEVEIKKNGTEADLKKIVDFLQANWFLEAEPQSKFERTLAQLDTSKSRNKLLSDSERAILQRITATVKDTYIRRAQALLALDEGLSGTKAAKRAGLSARQVRHWRKHFREDNLRIFPPQILDEALALPDIAPITLTREDAMAEAARKILWYHLQVMQAHKLSVFRNDDIEAVHDMRVATRKLRTAIALFGNYLDEKTFRPFAKTLRRTAKKLGSVRDLDVFKENVLYFAKTQSSPDYFAPLWEGWEPLHQRRFEALESYLNDEDFITFGQDFGAFLQIPNAGARPSREKSGRPLPHKIKHALPSILYQKLAAVLVYDDDFHAHLSSAERLHQLRIDVKALRYTLDFFAPLFNRDIKKLISKLKPLQNHLGELQDVEVAQNQLRHFLETGSWDLADKGGTPPDIPAVKAYLAACETTRQKLIDSFPAQWDTFIAADFHRTITNMVKRL